MRVLRAPARVRILRGPEAAAAGEAAAIIARARARETAIVSEAERAVAKLADEARTRGRSEAHAEVAALLVRANAERAVAGARDEADISALALDVARTLLGREVVVSSDVLRDVVRKAVGRVRRARRIVIRVHPDDAAAAREIGTGLLPAGVQPETFEIEPDLLVARGGAILETDLGEIDARIETQLAALGRALREA